MRRSFYAVARGVFALSLVASLSLSAAPREREPRERERPIVKIVKSVIRSLGDFITVPTPTTP
jgi:hypothetical protein